MLAELRENLNEKYDHRNEDEIESCEQWSVNTTGNKEDRDDWSEQNGTEI